MLERAELIARRRGTRWVVACVVTLGCVAAVGVVPRLLRAERRMVVAACPIAYAGEDGRIHLTNVEGTVDLELDGPPAKARVWFIGAPPAWSPCGELLAYQFDWRPDDSKIAVVEPGTASHWELPTTRNDNHFSGWFDAGVLHEVRIGLRHARTGALLRDMSALKPGPDTVMQIAPAPADQFGVGCISAEVRGITLRDERFASLRPVFVPHGPRRPRDQGWVPRLDPSGRWSAWTVSTWPESPSRLYISVKAVDDADTSEQRLVGDAFEDCVLGDWTDDGNILANVREKGLWGLAILDREGKLLQRIPTEVRPMAESGSSWRRRVKR